MNFLDNMIELLKHDEDIPQHVKIDVIKRVTDWCESGGSVGSEYIQRQYMYLIAVKDIYKKGNK